MFYYWAVYGHTKTDKNLNTFTCMHNSLFLHPPTPTHTHRCCAVNTRHKIVSKIFLGHTANTPLRLANKSPPASPLPSGRRACDRHRKGYASGGGGGGHALGGGGGRCYEQALSPMATPGCMGGVTLWGGGAYHSLSVG
jgi:hypothetical protein